MFCSINWIIFVKITIKLVKIRYYSNLSEQSSNPKWDEKTLKRNSINNEESKVHIENIKVSNKANNLSRRIEEWVT